MVFLVVRKSLLQFVVLYTSFRSSLYVFLRRHCCQIFGVFFGAPVLMVYNVTFMFLSDERFLLYNIDDELPS